MPGNEGKACDAVLRVIERRVEASRSHLRFPEQDGCGAPVELECQIGDGWFALEHTVIEAFGGQIVSDVQFGRLLGTMVEGLIGRLPAPGTYHLMFPTEPHLGLQASKLQTYKVAGRTIVLILESDDIALTNHVSVGEALEEIAGWS
jgi:hypothetical protein